MHLLESGEFLNVGLFLSQDTYLFLSQRLFRFFFTLIYLLMLFFFV